MGQQEFIASLVPTAKEHHKKYNLFASVTIAQAALESAWGQSQLSKKAYNLFGIKGTGPAGFVEMETLEVVKGQNVIVKARFRKYHDYAECLEDRAQILTSLSRYRDVLDAGTAEEQCKALKDGGWATDPAYATKLIQIMNQHGLKKYDVRPGPFRDVFSDHWAFAAIEKAKKKGIMRGYEDGTFRPDAPVTRADLAVVLERIGALK